MSSSSQSSGGKCRQISLNEIKESTNNFAESNVVGHGGEGKVYLAQIKLGWKLTQVAVKILKPNSQEFDKEIKTISKIQHPNLVSLLGYCNESGQKILLYEFMEKGSLADYVTKKSKISLSWLQRIRICLDAARGLQHLHIATDENSKGIIHRDVKPGNILLGKDWVAKISDFGMVKLSDADQVKSTMVTGLKGTGGYIAPEYVNYHSVTRKLDVYAFGVVLFQVLCQKTPWDRGDESYYGMEEEEEDLGIWAHQNVDPIIKPNVSDDSLKEFTAIVGKSLKRDPRKRPTMDGVVLGLEKVLKLLLEREYEAKKGRAAKESTEHSTAGSRRGSSSVVSETIAEHEYNKTIVLDIGGGITKISRIFEMEGETLYSFVIGRLHDLLVEEMEYLQALEVVVDELAKKLKEMEDLLEYAHVRKDKRTKEIIDLADQLIDFIEKYVIRVVNKQIGIRERLLRPKVCKAIEKITIKISDSINSQSGDADASSSDSRRPYKVQDLSRFNEKDFVGREEDINKLVSYLVDHEENEFRVISIYGMGGLGKTTLARKVYKDKKVLSHFQSFAFVCVSEQCRAEEILKHILQQLSLANEEEMKSMTQGDVIESLQRVQVEKRCLIIIDDIWSVVDWESLNCGLVDKSTGSKVLLTTRIKDVADKGFCYSLKCLSEDECWELCQKKIGTDRDSEIEKRKEELGRKMIAWCKGNPLAVCVLRGVLVTKYSLREWERFYDSRTWGGGRGGEVYQQFNSEVEEELLFSYKELPYKLRPCFLYMASLVEDEKIEVETLYMLWDAEGMILSKDRQVGETNMDVAERYLGELVGRCMIEAKLDEAHPNTKRRYKSCGLHDLMRKLCLSIVKKEDFLEVHDYRGRKDEVLVFHSSFSRNDTKLPPRQVLYFPWEHDFIVQDDKHNATGHVRSLMFKEGRARKLSKLKKLNLLRVLSFNFTSIGEEDITNELIHLRYLSLCGCRIVCLPSSIYDFIYLQTLDMQVYPYKGDKFRIPNLALRKLKGLKHLFLPKKGYYEVTPKFSRLRLDGLTKLETLVNLDSMTCEMEDVIHITNLRRLEWTICISSEDDGKKMKEFMNKVNLDRLWHSSLAIELDNPKVEMYSDVLRGQIPECCEEILHNLIIKGVTGKLLPEFSKFSRLTALVLREFEVKEDPMPTLEKLSNLEDLRLRDGKLKGKEMTCSSTGFPKLEFLCLKRLENLEKWCVKEGAMPNLRCVGIWGCSKLEMLPEKLKFISTLEELWIKDMPEEFERRLICREEDGTGDGPEFYKSQPRFGWDTYKISRRR